MFKHVDDVLTLGKGNRTIWSVPSDFDSQEEFGVSQVPQLEVLAQIGYKLVGRGNRGRSDGDIVNIDRDDDFDVVLSIDVEGMVRFDSFEAQIDQNGVELLVPLPGSLFQSIERFLELADLLRTTLVKALRLHHVEIFIQVTISEG